jgi:UDP-3-O-[3-hydroxymyristoyl] N-acetylglucosamine deacetylase
LSFTTRQQRTLQKTVTVEGFGYWSGRDVRVEFRPAPAGTGVVFVRTDLPKPARIPALVAHRIEVPRRTTLACNKARVEMVEHILAALAGLQIDNCEVAVNEPEMPGCDGSSQPFVAAIEQAGVVEQDAVREQLVVREVTRLGDENSWIEARPATAPGLSIRYRLDYGPGNAIGRQTLSINVTPQKFLAELASCRTFLLKEEADWLIAQGLGNRASLSDLLIFGEHGPIENVLRFSDECVRHKVLDVVGDLALSGCDVVGQIVAHKSGHRLNAELVRMLLIEGERVTARRKSA